jgi:hypothetical protein
MRNLWGQYCRCTLVAVLLCNAKAMPRVAGVRPAGFWGLWCRLAAGVMVIGRNGYVVGVGDDEGFGYAVVMVVVEGFGYAVELYALVLADGEY